MNSKNVKMSFYKNTEDLMQSKGFKIISKDFERPWGGFLVIDESQAQDFSNQFFKGINVDSLKIKFLTILVVNLSFNFGE